MTRPDTRCSPSPPTAWLPAKDMKIYGAEPLKDQPGFVRCPECSKTILKSAMTDHTGAL